MYDAIVVGARCAGSPTAMLLARQGYRVLLVDKARFPSDTMSGHFIHASGIRLLRRWGLLERLEATGCPPVWAWRIDAGPVVIEGGPHPQDDSTVMYGPRRAAFDQLLVDAAVESGVEFRDRFTVQDVIEDGGRITGIRGRSAGGASVNERARIIIGADGRHSVISRLVQAPSYNTRPALTCAYYTYWHGVEIDRLEAYPRPNNMILGFPTMDDLTLTYAAWPASEFKSVRTDVAGHFMQVLDRVPRLAERVRAGRQAGRFIGTVDLPNFFRVSHGPGWALVGDAGYHKDPYLAQGMADAFHGTGLLAEAVDRGLSGQANLDAALEHYEQQRNTAALPAYEHNCQLATLAPPDSARQRFMAAVSLSPEKSSRYIGALTGTVSYQDVFSPANVQRTMEDALATS
jgi:2-polyprenyl-6-methoxyphenol hydroxylase-like FAD-dependent oxidoreductase